MTIGAIVAPFVVLPAIWLSTFIDTALSQNYCAFGAVDNRRFHQLLRQAKEQDWTVWPGLSNGIFAPSERNAHPWSPTEPENKATNEKLLSDIRQLAGKHVSAEEQLAAVHALMRSINAEYVSSWPTFNFRHGKRLNGAEFTYFLPSIRFAPVCLFCLLWWNTTITVQFSYDAAADSYSLKYLRVLHAGLKYNPSKSSWRNASGPCPSFPPSRAY